MTNDEFRDLYAMLDARHKAVAGDHVGLSSLHPGGLIMFSRNIRKLLEQWEIEVARRAKAEAENARRTEECVRDDFGADAYDSLTPDYQHGLDFAHKPPR
jgi:hypothetical protein